MEPPFWGGSRCWGGVSGASRKKYQKTRCRIEILLGMRTGHHLQTLISALLVREGGYVDHPADNGGPTNMGITLGTLSAYRKAPCTKHDVMVLDDVEAREIYQERYWVEPGFFTLDISPVVVEMLFDTAVHSGPRRAVKLFQASIGVHADGHLGPLTREKAQTLTDTRMAAGFMAARVAYLGRIISKNHSQAVFAAGWMHRMAEFINRIPQA